VLDLADLLPPAEVLGEPAWVVGGAGHQGERARAGQYRLDAPSGHGHLAGVQGSADADDAVTGERLGQFGRTGHGLHRHPGQACPTSFPPRPENVVWYQRLPEIAGVVSTTTTSRAASYFDLKKASG